MNLFDREEVDSWLGRRNPTAKFVAHLLISLELTIVFDPVTPLAFLAFALIVGRLLARIHLSVLLATLVPFWLLGASLVVSNALFASSPQGRRHCGLGDH